MYVVWRRGEVENCRVDERAARADGVRRVGWKGVRMFFRGRRAVVVSLGVVVGLEMRLRRVRRAREGRRGGILVGGREGMLSRLSGWSEYPEES